MPYLSEKIIIEKTTYDRRVKLTDQDKDQIRLMYKLPIWSQRGLAIKFGVSRRLIEFVLNPNSLLENKKRREEHGGSKFYYKSGDSTIPVKNTRRWKHKLYLEGKIKLPELTKEEP